MTGAGNGVETQLVGLACGILAIGNDADALALHVVQMASGEVEGDVVHASNGTLGKKAVIACHRADEGILGLVEIDGNVGVAHCWLGNRGLGGRCGRGIGPMGDRLGGRG